MGKRFIQGFHYCLFSPFIEKIVDGVVHVLLRELLFPVTVLFTQEAQINL